MLLDIIVPHYNEDVEIVKPLFNILDSQKGINFNDFRVHLIHNGDIVFDPDEFHDHYRNLQIKDTCIFTPGVSHARNYGIDHSDADWICFCDCDDCFTSVFALMMIFHVLRSENSKQFNMIWGPFYVIEGTNLTLQDTYNNVFIHNKFYRRSFLNEHGIRFNEKLFMSEDSAFNALVRFEIGEHGVGQIDKSEPRGLYAWCRRPGSVTMATNYENRWVRISEGHFDRNLYVLELFKERKPEESNVMVARTITDAYAMLTKTGASQDQAHVRKRVANFYLENKELFDTVSPKILEQAIEASNKDAGINEENIKARPSLSDWIEEIVSQ